MLPLDPSAFGPVLSTVVFLLVGFSFGAVLEMAGFGDARKLTAQFYLRDMTVVKVMFAGIVTASLLLFGSAGLGLLDYSEVFVNPTYLWPGVIGGLVMGAGFVVGGYCPGTSIVSAASLKLDGMLFVVGAIVGVGLFGETAASITRFWNASYTPRLTLPDWLGWSIGATVVAVTIVALLLFYVAERTEAWMANRDAPVNWRPEPPYAIGAAVAVFAALLVWGLGQPTPEEKWESVSDEYQTLLDERAVFIHPLEYVKSWNDASIKLVSLDLRPAAAFKAFHLDSARNVTFDDLAARDFVFELDQLAANGLVILIADDEELAVRSWRRLKALGVVNLYMLEHGLRDWKSVLADVADTPHFDYARPPAKVLEAYPEGAYTPKIKLEVARRAAGLCG